MLRHSIALVAVSFLAAVPLLAQPETANRATSPTAGSAILELAGGSATSVPYLPGDGGPLFALRPLVERLGGELTVGPGYQLRLPDTLAVFGPGSQALTIDREIVQLSEAPRHVEESLYVPIDLFRHTYGRVLGYSFTWKPAERRLEVAGSRTRVSVDWNLVQIEGITTLALRFPEPVRFRVDERPGRVTVELVGGRLVPPDDRTPPADPFLRDIRFGDRRIELELAPGATVEHYTRSDPFRIVFDLFGRSEIATDREEAESEIPAISDQVETIVIDPGHGGEETGAIGPSGTQEKELTLLLARTLARRLEQRLPVRVVLTRTEDRAVPLDTRTAIANQHQAELFISLHLNSSPAGGGHGAETYFLSLEAEDRRAARAARHSNREGEGGGDEESPLSDLQLILWDLAQSEHLAESQHLAKLIQTELNDTLGLEDRGVKQAPFRVLMGATTPAVLVELGFLSNPEEEERLRQPSYRAELAEALVRAVSLFLSSGDETARLDDGTPTN